MKSNKEYLNEDNLKNIQTLLDDCSLEKLIDSDNITKEEITEGDDLPELIDSIFQGSLNIRMDPMKMSLFMELKAPVNTTNEITIAVIKDKIEYFGPYCEARIDWESVRDIYTRIMFDGEIIPEIKIAKGEPVKFNILEHIILKEGLIIDLKPLVLENKKVDFHHIHSYVMLHKGEFIGDIIPELPGVNGKNLMGEEISAPKKIINIFKPGRNIFVKSGKIFSEIDGSFKIIENELIVDSVLFINTDIDYRTGDIEFTGDVHINKSIREGFNVESMKDILVEESIEPSNILCGNNLIVKHGIIGSEKYTIAVKGMINALHAENVKIKGLGSISIENSVINSEIYSTDKLVVGEKGSIIGGFYNIQNGVIAGNIGNKYGVETEIHIGVDYTIEEKLHNIQETSITLTCEMNKLQMKISKSNSREDRDNIKYLFLKIKSRLNSFNNYSRMLLSRLDKNDMSKVVVMGTIYPGTHIEICHVSYTVDKKLSGVKFLLDKANGCVRFDYI